MNILFICKHNRFRSKISEAVFNKLNNNKKIKVDSAAIKPDYIPVAENVQKALKEIGVRRANKHPKKVTKEMLNWADIIVIAADNVNIKIKGKKIIKWSISDTDQVDYKGILKRAKTIEKRVKNLISVL